MYNQDKAGTMDTIVCPPYDIISPLLQEELYQKNPFNVVRLEYGKENADDTESNNRYTRSSAFFEEWFRSRILYQDPMPAMYVYEMEYTVGGTVKKPRGFIALVKIEDYNSGVVKPHETTLSGPKSDRLNLLRACKASFSQIYSLFSDPSGDVAAVLSDVPAKSGAVAIGADKVIHRIWPIHDQDTIQTIVRLMEEKPLFIADGHHRYDTALNYRNERRAAEGGVHKDASYNYVAMFMARLEDPGIMILPAHRVLMNLTHFYPAEFEQALNRYFYLERIDFTSRTEEKDRETILDTMANRSERSHVFGMRIKGKNSYYLLTLRDASDMDALVPDRSRAYRQLDVSILHHLIIDKLLGIGIETHKLGKNISYIKDPDEAAEQVANGSSEIVFFMNPTKVTQVKDVASSGERMPQKATYFYPKLLTGLVMHKL